MQKKNIAKIFWGSPSDLKKFQATPLLLPWELRVNPIEKNYILLENLWDFF